MDNITLSQAPVDTETTTAPAEPQVRFVDIEVTDDNVALNLMVAFLNAAQRRGAYSIDESSKIWECIKRFIKADPNAPPTPAPTA
jgi:hypothetical protein